MELEGKKPEEGKEQEPGGTGFKTVVENGHEYVVNEATGEKFFQGTYVKKLTEEAATNRKKLEAFEAKQEEEAKKLLIEQGKFKELSESQAAKLAAQETELAKAREELKAIADAKEEERKALWLQLPKEKQPLFETASAAVIRETLSLLKIEVKGNPDPKKPKIGTPNPNDGNVPPWAGMYPTMEGK